MAIDQIPSSTETAAGDLDVPEFMQPDYVPTKPSPVAIQSAAMVVARAAGRGTGAGANWFAAGVVGAKDATKRHLRADDYVEDIGGIEGSNANWQKRQDIRHERRVKFLKAGGITAAGTLVANLIAWGGLTWGAEMAAADAWAVAPTAETFLGLLAVTAYGRRVSRRQLPAAPVVPMIGPGEPEDDGEPFPLAWCKDGEQVVTCIQRAFKAEGIGTRQVTILGFRGWGWELAIELKGATPGKVLAVSDQIEGHLALPDGGFMPEPDSTDKSKITVRLVASNPFADMPRPTVHAPNSLSVHDTVVMGRTMDGSTLELSLDGFCALIIGAMGAGKSLGALRTINEALTACRDAVVWDLDPIKGGLSEFGDLMARRARGPEECEEALEEGLSYVAARGKLMHTLNMGDRWHATAEHPNLYINIDEFIQLSQRGKDLAIKILRTGRQYGIYLIMAGQEATADSLGDAIASIVAYRILMACRFEDVKIAFGVGAGALGWRPDRMKPAVGPVANDAGQAMIKGGALARAIRHQFNAYTREQISHAVPERLTAGRPRMDADTLLGSGTKLSTAGHAEVLVDRLDALATDDAAIVAVLLRQFEEAGAQFLPTSEVLLPALGQAGHDMDSERLGRLLRKHAPGVTASRDTEANGRRRGWDRSVIEQATTGLLDPAGARLQAG
jgi:S-DNA-T family DNA segregation ATPase FtsK/SpoIIIE